ncbi:hypothetical protein BDV30DRAFT_109791 [Aspergillus minisclerotigenes]|uniref:Uncharacterized protein n=1 Tax=Aspergillus minisclerotigenes TaxID=656917 RepID=A0A5N6J6A3_9EURO|nr:hypothetical protein BDV30DRAFT_109791 [Aspergillus minisclerotigenes]
MFLMLVGFSPGRSFRFVSRLPGTKRLEPRSALNISSLPGFLVGYLLEKRVLLPYFFFWGWGFEGDIAWCV